MKTLTIEQKGKKLFKYIKISYHCPICNLQFNKKQQVKDHIMQHDNYIEEYYNYYIVNNCDYDYLNVSQWLDDNYISERRVNELLSRID